MPPLTLENASALVPGGGARKTKENDMQVQKPGAQPANVKVKILRAFYYQGKPLAKDEIVTIPRLFALEMAAANKAEIINPEPAPREPEKAPEPVKPDQSADSARPDPKKGDRNAR